jgi:hypothetical protein
MTFVETHLWEDTELAVDIWKGRWSKQLKQVLATILGVSCSGSAVVHSKDFSRGLRWLPKLTALLQKLLREQFSTRHPDGNE